MQIAAAVADLPHARLLVSTVLALPPAPVPQLQGGAGSSALCGGVFDVCARETQGQGSRLRWCRLRSSEPYPGPLAGGRGRGKTSVAA